MISNNTNILIQLYGFYRTYNKPHITEAM